MMENTYHISNVIFHDLSAKAHGAAISVDRLWANLSIINDEFIWCRCDGTSYVGGGIYANVANFYVNCSIFDRCYAYNKGCALHSSDYTKNTYISSFLLCNILYSEYNFVQDVIQVSGQKENKIADGNITNSSPKDTCILALYSSTNTCFNISFLNIISIRNIPSGSVVYTNRQTTFSCCNFDDWINVCYFFHLDGSLKVSCSKCVFDNLSIKKRSTGSGQISFDDCFISDSALAKILGTTTSGSSVSTINIHIHKGCINFMDRTGNSHQYTISACLCCMLL